MTKFFVRRPKDTGWSFKAIVSQLAALNTGMATLQPSQLSSDNLWETAGQHVAAASTHRPDTCRRMEKAAGKERCQQQQQQHPPREGRSWEHVVRSSSADPLTSALHNMTSAPTGSHSRGRAQGRAILFQTLRMPRASSTATSRSLFLALL